MGFVTINHDEAKFAHQDFYEGDFEVVLMKRAGPFDFPPYSFVYGLSDFGSWDGLISTDGKKMVITKSKFTDLAKAKKSWEVEVTDIIEVKFNFFKVYFKFNKKIPGLTMIGLHPILKAMMTPLVLYPFLSKKILQIRIDNQFKNEDAFADLLKK